MAELKGSIKHLNAVAAVRTGIISPDVSPPKPRQSPIASTSKFRYNSRSQSPVPPFRINTRTAIPHSPAKRASVPASTLEDGSDDDDCVIIENGSPAKKSKPMPSLFERNNASNNPFAAANRPMEKQKSDKYLPNFQEPGKVEKGAPKKRIKTA